MMILKSATYWALMIKMILLIIQAQRPKGLSPNQY